MTEKAEEIIAGTGAPPSVAKSRWFEDVVRGPVAILAADLPREAVEAAREAGRGRDLTQLAREVLAELEGMMEEAVPDPQHAGESRPQAQVESATR
jgi:hypothetical protein